MRLWSVEGGRRFWMRDRVDGPVLATLVIGLAGILGVLSLLESTMSAYGMWGSLRLLRLMSTESQRQVYMSPTRFEAEQWKRDLVSFESVAAFRKDEALVRGEWGSERVGIAFADHTVVDLLGLQLLAGRQLEADDAASPTRGALIGRRLARRAFGEERSAVGRTLHVNGAALTVLGVVAMQHGPASSYLEDVQVMQPLHGAPGERVEVVARLASGSSLAQAQLELDRWASAHGVGESASASRRFIVLSGWEQMDGLPRRVLGGSLLVVTLLSLVVSCNLVHLLRARAAARVREIAIRTALGARRSVLLLSEVGYSTLMTLVAMALAASFTVLGFKFGVGRLPPTLSFLEETEVGTPAFALATVLCFAVVLFGRLAQLCSADLGCLVGRRSRNRGSAGPSPWGRALSSLHLATMAGSSLLLGVAALLLTASLVSLTRAQFGLALGEVQVVTASFPEWKARDQPALDSMAAALLERLAALPDVESVALSSQAPPRTGVFVGEVAAEGHGHEPLSSSALGLSTVGPGYFRTLGQRILAGREFTTAEVRGGDPVVVISEGLARRVWDRPERALGRFLRFGTIERQVVGVVAELRLPAFLSPVGGSVAYWPLTRLRPSVTVLVRAKRPLATDVERVARELDPDLAVEHRALAEVFLRSVEGVRLMALLLVVASLIVSSLAVFGVYAVVTQYVEVRRRQIAVRFACGATAGAVQRWVLRRGLLPVASGLLFGLALSFPLGAMLASQLYQVEPNDWSLRLTVAAVILAFAALAIWLPAWRLSRTDAAEVLRSAEAGWLRS